MVRPVDLIGRYEVLGHLATGSMGQAYLARSTGPGGFERHVVLKMLDSHIDEQTAKAMFLDEARVIGRMHHQHIAPAFAVDCDDDGRYFLVMDYVHGQTLKAVWTRTRELGLELPLDFTLTVVIAAASALHYAHTLLSRDGTPLHIVHRDVSLSNLMIGYDGAIKLIDFGIAKVAQRSEPTRVGKIAGNVGYMAPEQIGGEAIDHRADIFALGVVLYELSTMTRPFQDRVDSKTPASIRRCKFVPPSRIVDSFPMTLEGLIATALQANPSARFRDAEAFRKKLEAFARSRSTVLGDAAIVPIMKRLFPDHTEPWQAGAHAQSDAVPVASDDDYWTVPVETPVVIAPEDNVTVPFAEPLRTIARAPRFVMPSSGQLATVERGIEQAPSFPIAESMPRRYPLGSSTFAKLEPAPSASLVSLVSFRPAAPLAVERSPRALHWIVVTFIAAVILGVGLGALVTKHQEPRPAPAPPIAAPPALKPTVMPIEVDAGPGVTTIQITTAPDDATVLLDGERLGRTPFTATLPPAPGPHTIKIRRRGYVPQWFEVDLGADVTRHIVLQPLFKPPLE